MTRHVTIQSGLLALAAVLLLHPALAAVEPSARDRDKSQEFYEEAVEEVEQGDINAAVIQLRNALQRNPNNAEARLLLGKLYLRIGNLPSAEKELSRAHELAPSDESEIELGQALLLQNEPERVLDLVGEEAKTPELTARKLMLRGGALRALDKQDEAEALFKQAQALAPKMPEPHVQLAQSALARGDLDAAAAEVKTALTLAPDFVPALLLQGNIALERGANAEAIAAYRKAARAAPRNVRAHIGLAQAYLRAGQSEEAKTALDQALEIQPDNVEAVYLQTVMDVRAGRYEEANRRFRTIADAVRDYPPAQLLEGLIKLQTREYAQAEQALARYVTNHPEQLAVKRVLAGLYLHQNRPTAAIELLEEIAAAHPEDVGVTRALASAYLQAGEYSQAATALEQLAASGNAAAARQAKGSLALLGELAEVPDLDEKGGAELLEPKDEVARGILLTIDSLQTGQRDRALEQVTALAEKAPDNPVVLNLKGGVHLAREELPAARESFAAALRQDPDFAPAHTNLVRLDIREGKTKDAERRLRTWMDTHPQDAGAVLNLAEFLVSQERADEAVRLLQAKSGGAVESLPLRTALIRLHLQRGQTEEAARAAEDLLAVQPEEPAALGLAGQAFLQAGKPERAVAAFERLAEKDPKALGPNLALASALSAAGETERARDVLTGAQAAHPKDSRPTVALVALEMQADRYEPALAAIGRLEETAPVVAARLRTELRLRQYQKTGEAKAELDQAIAALERIVAENPDEHQSRLLLGTALITLEDWAAAEPHFAALVEAFPDDALVLNNLAWIKSELGRPDALDYARRAHAAAPNSPPVADTLGWLLVRDGKLDEGLSVLREAAAQAPDSPDIQYHLAVALQKSGEEAEAERLLADLLARDQDFTEREDAVALLARLRED